MAMCRGKDMFDAETLLSVNRDALASAVRNRHQHTGYMAHYPKAKGLVQREIEREGSTTGMLASWF